MADWSRNLTMVLADSGLCLWFPANRHMPASLRALIDLIKAKPIFIAARAEAGGDLISKRKPYSQLTPTPVGVGPEFISQIFRQHLPERVESILHRPDRW